MAPMVTLDLADVTETNDGLLVTMRRSGTNQEGKRDTVVVMRGKIALPGGATGVAEVR
jgi:hypothetical protein